MCVCVRGGRGWKHCHAQMKGPGHSRLPQNKHSTAFPAFVFHRCCICSCPCFCSLGLRMCSLGLIPPRLHAAGGSGQLPAGALLPCAPRVCYCDDAHVLAAAPSWWVWPAGRSWLPHLRRGSRTSASGWGRSCSGHWHRWGLYLVMCVATTSAVPSGPSTLLAPWFHFSAVQCLNPRAWGLPGILLERRGRAAIPYWAYPRAWPGLRLGFVRQSTILPHPPPL